MAALRQLFFRHERALYLIWAALCTMASARQFYGYMMMQTGGEWSAPLDDVFIHFDYARAAAEGHPFEWFSGNGYSSGNTSLLYPFVLAFGWLLGFRDAFLMKWAAIVAMTCTFGVLWIARGFVIRALPERSARVTSFLIPPMFLALGALDWSLWSGMEVAFLLGVWALALAAYFHFENTRTPGAAWWLGVTGFLLVVTRPEAATTIAGFGVAAALAPRLRLRDRVFTLLRVGSPAAIVLAAQSFANRALTGEANAAGAIVKLALNNPFLSPEEKLADYTQNLRYAIFRNLEYHFTDFAFTGCIVPVLALLAIAVKETRKYALLLVWQVCSWMAVVALNGQVRWQNERYTMPAVAWLLLCAALGACALFRKKARPSLVLGALAVAIGAHLVAIVFRAPYTIPELRLPWVYALAIGLGVTLMLRTWPLRAPMVAAALLVANDHQIAKLRDQKWFFGRACRNIRDQHIRAGNILAELHPRRVLVGDAGALVYASNRPGLDIIGLGGYHDLPFARAGVNGLAASIELIERMPESDRPDLFAIYPSWWGTLPTWFASDVVVRIPAPGNVICGGYEDVIYRADWHVLGTGDRARVPIGHEKDAIDFADLVSEREHQYTYSRGSGWTDMKILPDLADARKDVFDGGRILYAHATERFVLENLEPHHPATFAFRTAPAGATTMRVRIQGRELGVIALAPKDGWDERTVHVPPDAIDAPQVTVEIENDGPGELPLFHAWLGQ
ncbi:MAG TPA: hypothetical protein VH054_03660 [Polyangiaceae bacterium]|nr:hypothetical protein [Polyangiaceae bacterium]